MLGLVTNQIGRASFLEEWVPELVRSRRILFVLYGN